MAFPQFQKVLLPPAFPEVIQYIVEVLNPSSGLGWADFEIFIIEWTTVGEMFRQTQQSASAQQVRGCQWFFTVFCRDVGERAGVKDGFNLDNYSQ